MRSKRTIGWLCGWAVLMAVGGCANANRAAAPAEEVEEPVVTAATPDVAPLHSELPDLAKYNDRSISPRIGVERYTPRAPRERIVPQFKPIELTPAERAVLGEPKQEPADDLLVFYRPPPSPERGVLPFDSRPDRVFYVPGLRMSGVIPASTNAGVYSETVGFYRAGSFVRRAAGAYPATEASGGRYAESSVRVGVNESKRISRHARTIDY